MNFLAIFAIVGVYVAFSVADGPFQSEELNYPLCYDVLDIHENGIVWCPGPKEIHCCDSDKISGCKRCPACCDDISVSDVLKHIFGGEFYRFPNFPKINCRICQKLEVSILQKLIRFAKQKEVNAQVVENPWWKMQREMNDQKRV